jgi:hypothetical protein
VLGRVATQALGEGEFEDELEFEHEYEDEFEFETEVEFETEAEVELMAAVAANARSDAEAEAMIGAATARILSQADRRALRAVLPHLVRGVAVLTRLLRRRPQTRAAVRTIPTIVRNTASSLARRTAQGQRVNVRTAARTMAAQTRRVLASPATCQRVIATNVRATRNARTPQRPTNRRERRP